MIEKSAGTQELNGSQVGVVKTIIKATSKPPNKSLAVIMFKYTYMSFLESSCILTYLYIYISTYDI